MTETASSTWWVRSGAWVYVTAASVTSLLTVFALQLWKADLSVPLTYRGDALPTGAHFKTVIEQGWYESQPLLGAPAGQIYHDFPTADNLHLIGARILSVFTSDWAIAMNAYFLLGFPLVALAAVWFLRKVGVSGWVTVALATLYALAPYHWLRGESHLWLASYYTVPLALGLVVIALRGERLWGRGDRAGALRWVLSPTSRTIVIAALLATSSSYYSVFFLVLIAATGLLCLVRDRSWARFWGAAAAGGVTVVVMLFNMLPDLIFSWVNGQNPLGVERSAGEAEYYALKLSQLLLPWSGHRISILSELRQKYDSGYVSLGEQPALGLIGAIGLVIALLVVAYLAVERVRQPQRPFAHPAFTATAGLAGLVFVAFIFSTLGGLSTIISIFTSSLRGWNRMSIVIAMLCLAIVGLAVDYLLSRIANVRTRTISAGLTALLLVGVGYVDQTPGDSDAEYVSNAESFRANQQYFDEVQDALEPGDMVLVLPYVPFPESVSPSGLLASDQLIPYLHTSTVRWSSGGIKGRPAADWPGELEQYGVENVATLGALAGFSGILIDRLAGLDSARELEEAVALSTNATPLIDDRGRYAFFSLDIVRASLEATHSDAWIADAAELILNPTLAYRVPSFGPTEDDPFSITARSGTGQFTIVNDSEVAKAVVVSFLLSDRNSSDTVALALPGNARWESEQTELGRLISASVTVPPGSHLVTLSLTGANGAAVPEVTISKPAVKNLAIVGVLDELD